MEKEILTPKHKYWPTLCFKLDQLDCNHDLRHTIKILKSLPNIDVERTVDFLENHGGFCDCEVLMNVDRWRTFLSQK